MQAFGLNVTESLRLIQDPRDRALCKLKIQELLVQYQLYPPSKQSQHVHGNPSTSMNAASPCAPQPGSFLSPLNDFTAPNQANYYMEPPK